MSMTIVPGWIALKMPSGPSSTFSTSGESGSIVMIRVGLARDVRRRGRARGARGDELVDRLRAAAVHDETVAALRAGFWPWAGP